MGMSAARWRFRLSIHARLPASGIYIHFMRLSFRDIDYFLAFSSSANRLEAAALLGVTLSALNRAIQRVETEFGLALVVRHARTACMTREGERFVTALQAMSTGYSQASRVIVELRERDPRASARRGQVRDIHLPRATCT
ncbi:LysR family transcriptional regulator [Variovorax sp. RKNM96]|uniref:helix-turn-helix domain-containing protein n=1 Tax=Variovorax sp. RKNM96 TaxID=2681552 RepID=UPI00197F4B24|nr:LysR family transcriptional regulator [Variovorax sp. RKNM96]QSI29141.1 LysR family transcriptional regulator [Variovorax sp. RKNM96]